MESTEKSLTLTRASLNVEKMPIVFLGTPEDRKKIQIEIAKTGKPLLIYHVTEDGVEKKLFLTPSSVHGLLTAFDMDVLTVIHHKLFDAKKTIGYCPPQMRLWLSDFPKVMKLATSGGLYDRIIESVKRLSETDIYHENFVKISETATKTVGSYREKSLKIIVFKGSGKEVTKTGGSERMQKVFIDIDIPEWHCNNINSGYTTEFDPNIYFNIGNDRARRLYRVLEIIRYQESVFLPYSKLISDLTLGGLENKLRNRALKRALDPLVKIGYIKGYKLCESSIQVTYNAVRKPIPQTMATNITYDDLDIYMQRTVDWLMGELKDSESSRNWISNIVAKVPEQMLHLCLSLTKETAVFNGIRKSAGAVFTDHLKRECERLNIPL